MTTKKAQIGWVDLLRVAACFMVVFSHCCDAFVAQFDADRVSFLTGVFAGSLVRCSVPLFVMMTGVLLLPVNEGMAHFYRKRIGRLLWPLLFWSLVLPLLFFLYLHYFPSQSPCIDATQFAADVTLVKLYTFVFNFTYDTTPLWYLYMLVGLYFIMPILSSWLQSAQKRDVKLFLWVWGISLLLPYLNIAAPALGYMGNFGNMGLFGVCDWNVYGTFYYVSGFVGYLVLAHYLVKYPLQWSRAKTWGITLPMFVVGYLITAFGYVEMQKSFPGNYAYLEIVWLFAGINVFMMTFPVFVWVQMTKLETKPWLSSLARLTFGIYLCHFVFVQAGYDLFNISSLPYWARIVTSAIFSFGVSALLVCVMYRFKITRIFVQ